MRYKDIEAVATSIIDQIISDKLLHASCIVSEDHDCQIVWAGNAAQQIAEGLRRAPIEEPDPQPCNCIHLLRTNEGDLTIEEAVKLINSRAPLWKRILRRLFTS